jgi:hypothetical protein
MSLLCVRSGDAQPSVDTLAFLPLCSPQFLDRSQDALPDPLPVHVAIRQQRVASPCSE